MYTFTSNPNPQAANPERQTLGAQRRGHPAHQGAPVLRRPPLAGAECRVPLQVQSVECLSSLSLSSLELSDTHVYEI